MALALVHDLLLSKTGVAAASSHPLRRTIEKHGTRLKAELARVRVKRRAASLAALRDQVNAVRHHVDRPRWVRINTLKTTLDDQLRSTFAAFSRGPVLHDVMAAPSHSKVLYLDPHVPNLLALPSGSDLSGSRAYRQGEIILQDKASCFPAYLLDPCSTDGDIVDACAAPGNKTTHLAALLRPGAPHDGDRPRRWIHAVEKDRARASTLASRIDLSGAAGLVSIHAGQDFLRLDPADEAFKNVHALLLDPSCSGSGIVGRGDALVVTLPGLPSEKKANSRRRKAGHETCPVIKTTIEPGEEAAEADSVSTDDLAQRLIALSAFQAKLLTHALHFPSARRLTYSTCSIHARENEHVVMQALCSDVARQRGWRMLTRAEQVSGLRDWPVRGQLSACAALPGHDPERAPQLAEACIRCNKDDGMGTMGFFVAAFVRDEEVVGLDLHQDEAEWHGLDEPT